MEITIFRCNYAFGHISVNISISEMGLGDFSEHRTAFVCSVNTIQNYKLTIFTQIRPKFEMNHVGAPTFLRLMFPFFLAVGFYDERTCYSN